tara:strand:- start:5469 stop:6350 length:882 start_codon:yes stop_codon:yes gene_type:complete
MNEQVTEAQPENKQPPKSMVMRRQKYTNEEKREREEKELAELVEQNKQQATESQTIPEQEPEVTGEEKTFKKRYGDLRRHMQEKDKEVQGQLDELKRQLSEATQKEIKLPKSEDDIEAWASKYPDVAAIVETIAIKKAREQSDAIAERVKALDEMQQNVTREKAEAELLKLHPDFNEIKDEDSFHEWADEQPKWVQDALYENDTDARSAGRAIDLYKADMGITGKKKQTSNDAAKSVNTKSVRNAPPTDDTKAFIKESDVNKMSTQEYEKKADSIMEAIRAGKFVYDISGNAR